MMPVKNLDKQFHVHKNIKKWIIFQFKNCETDLQSRLDAWDKCSGLMHWDDPEGWDEKGGGRAVQDGEHM